ncbi:hypothetical protein SRHO_G00045960 [Serrasalmus rhombeus]
MMLGESVEKENASFSSERKRATPRSAARGGSVTSLKYRFDPIDSSSVCTVVLDRTWDIHVETENDPRKARYLTQ